MLRKLRSCPVCNSKKIRILKTKINSKVEQNFYVKAILENLNINFKSLNEKIKKYLCKNCHSIFHSPWFNNEVARKVFLTIYGQHNYGWQNLDFFIKQQKPANHGNLFKDLKKITNFKSYGEYNCPFSGLYFDILLEEIRNKKFLKQRLNNSNNLIYKNQDAFKKKQIIKINSSILKNNITKKYKKIFIYGNDPICWGKNCISKNCNCIALGENFFGYSTNEFSDDNLKKIDLFGLFMTLDHTYKPLEVLKKSLNLSKVVLIHAHINSSITKQHLFSLGKNFSSFLTKNKIFCFDLTEYIEKDKNRNKGKNYKDNEMYLVCSYNKNQIQLFSSFYNKSKKFE